MSLLRTRLKPRPHKLSSMTAVCSDPQFEGQYQHTRRASGTFISSYSSNDHRSAPRTKRRQGEKSFEDIFIRSLVQASSCRQCRQPAASQRVSYAPIESQKRNYSSSTSYKPFVQDRPREQRDEKSLPSSQSYKPLHRNEPDDRSKEQDCPSPQPDRSFRQDKVEEESDDRAVSSPPRYRPFHGDEIIEENEENNLEETTKNEEPPPLGEHIPPSEYRQLAETYDSPSDLWEQPSETGVGFSKKLLHMPLAPRLVLTPEQENRPPYASRVVLPPEDYDHDMQLRRFNRLIEAPLGIYTNRIWSSYQKLQGPRPRYLTDMAISRVFRHLTWVENKDEGSSRRYFTFLNEVLGERIPIDVHQWNSSISFAARWLRHTTSDEVKKAIETWLRMENAGVQADHVTFNILFDAAIRAKRFGLADTICNEIKQRDLPIDRDFRVSMIYYAGARRDGDAVRKAFRDLVDASEIVDTTVMNCVIVSLIRAGEGESADSAYIKMKHLHETKFGTPGPRNWRQRRAQTDSMAKIALNLRKDKRTHEFSFFGGSFSSEDKREEAQRRASIHPDAHTYRILIKYNAHTVGNLERCRELLNESKDGGWPVHGSIYQYLFQGFCIHGGHAYTSWNRRSLEELWLEFLDASSPERLRKATTWAKAERKAEIEERAPDFFDIPPDDIEDDEDDMLSHEERPPYFTVHLARRAVHAFYKCAGRKRMIQVWKQILERWTDMNEEERRAITRDVDKLVNDDVKYVE